MRPRILWSAFNYQAFHSPSPVQTHQSPNTNFTLKRWTLPQLLLTFAIGALICLISAHTSHPHVRLIVTITTGSIYLLINPLSSHQTQQASFIVDALQTPSSEQLRIVLYIVSLSFFLILLITPQLNVALMSEVEAQSL